jgi:sulfur carrier protein
MTMKVNGKVSELNAPKTVRELIAEMGYREDRVAVELNGGIVPRSEYGNVYLDSSDSAEIVEFVGGG